ncbi:hydrolase [Acinetobacter gyllenbergii]|uniref:Phosphoglycolate phosphatase n=1 Tax=Acinetobacter gyllenbergii CIP 110306 = MTCC 11365 TaxID=1217657 RepID=A0A829HG17_9GAMM|nr:HAD-IA family hydrolase [Acinetobacter gyllenbergii]EPF77406.1 phosphoglycolate phosphatase [Acinetobacter gyllenbergii CIP 110306 = MTCC 11365]EPH33425.1 Phosphoglycolate phosphatase [Acinetobacter gyllenbergii CIP 110306 = MTCC 11365]MCU4581059.1 HAD-IA family hydrolase [Acinetobacter gyllenbergii]OBY73595.1 hydrolase [Acinetobacter gyllenbergii]GMA11297.1 hydrolase [Acinetobacter gyllenbergii]
MTIKNILIDLDGTLTDPKTGIHGSIRFALEKLGQPVADDVDLDWTIGPPLKASLAKLLNTQDDDFAEQALLAYRERFSVTGLFENEVYPTVVDTLQQLQAQGYALFLATAKPIIYAKKILAHFQLDQYFTEMYGSELTGERTNKADLIAYILEQQQLDAQHCIMVGDRQYDIIGARANGIETIAVNYGYGRAEELAQAQPVTQISQFSQLIETVAELNAERKVS